MTVEPVSGWRRWAILSTSDGFRLASTVQQCVWQPRYAARATHRARWPVRRRHAGQAPVLECSCGIYAYRMPWPALGTVAGTLTAFGQVALWGRVVEHEAGFRAELAYPQRIRVPYAGCGDLSLVRELRFAETAFCGRCLMRPGVYALPERDTILGDEIGAVCEQCADRADADELWRIADVQTELLNAYAVDVLP